MHIQWINTAGTNTELPQQWPLQINTGAMQFGQVVYYPARCAHDCRCESCRPDIWRLPAD